MNKPNASASSFPQLPPYTYVPGVTPHPISHPDGHMHGGAELPSDGTPRDVMHWGITLFNNGYYWEAHEAWEHLWLELGRVSAEALIVKGLIKLAACGVKCLVGNAAGAKRHAVRAVELLAGESTDDVFAEVNFDELRKMAHYAENAPPVLGDHATGEPEVIPGFRIANEFRP